MFIVVFCIRCVRHRVAMFECIVVITFLHTQKKCTYYARLVVIMTGFVTYGIKAASTHDL
jgi:hypothetical protein